MNEHDAHAEGGQTRHALRHLRRLTVKPDDVLVVTYPGPLLRKHCDGIEDMLHDTLGCTNKVLILDNGTRLSLIRTEDKCAEKAGK